MQLSLGKLSCSKQVSIWSDYRSGENLQIFIKLSFYPANCRPNCLIKNHFGVSDENIGVTDEKSGVSDKNIGISDENIGVSDEKDSGLQ